MVENRIDGTDDRISYVRMVLFEVGDGIESDVV